MAGTGNPRHHAISHLGALRAGISMNPFLAKQVQLERTGTWTLGALGLSTVESESIAGARTGVAAAGLATGIGTGVASAIGAGAAAGSVVPVVGTAIGAIVGLLASGLLSHKNDPEMANLGQAITLWQQNQNAVYNIANKYLVLAGFFDLQGNQLQGNYPIYNQYGRMGEERFTLDLTRVIQSAANTGQITAQDTPLTVMQKVVLPWIASFNKGTLQDPNNGNFINAILTGMVADYVTGNQGIWRARSGDRPASFSQIPPFTLPTSATQAATQSAPSPVSPSQQVAPAQPVAPVPTYASQNPTGPPPPFAPTTQYDPQYGLIYMRPGDASRYVWVNGTVLNIGVASAAAPSTPTVPTPIPVATPTSVPIPAGFLVAGQSNNLPIYQGPDGNYYSWSGTTMTPFTGALMTSTGLPLNVTAGIAQQSVSTSALPSIFGSPTSPGYSAPILNSAAPAYTPTAVTPVTAGVSGSGLPSWLTWGALAGVALLMFATARPLRGSSYKRASM